MYYLKSIEEIPEEDDGSLGQWLRRSEHGMRMIQALGLNPWTFMTEDHLRELEDLASGR